MSPEAKRPIAARPLTGAALAAVLVAILVIVLSGSGDGGHRVEVVTPSARFIVPGLRVTAAGQKVGEVAKVEVTPDNHARLELRIDNDDVWPLRRGTRARFRWAGTVKMTGRYVELAPGPSGAGPIPDGGVIRATDATGPVDFATSPSEFDDLFGTFGPRTRTNLRATLDKGGPALAQAAPQLRRTLDRTPGTLAEARAVLDDLGSDQDALDTLVRSSDRVVDAIDSSNPDVGRLIAGAGTTFEALATRSRELGLALDRLPATLVSARRSLSHADRTLLAASDLTRRLSPGVAEIRRLARPLEAVLSGVVDVGPDARQTLSTLRRATPELNPFLTRARNLMPTIRSIGRQAAPQLACIRPYIPEISNFFVSWTGLWGGAEPGGEHFARAMAGSIPWNNGTSMSAGQIADTIPGITSSWPSPPGHIVAQPWFQPQCGITEDALDPDKDPETRPGPLPAKREAR